MSVLFPKLNKPREWDYRPIYYDKDKEARKDKLARLRQNRLSEDYARRREERQQKQSRRMVWLMAAVLLLGLLYYLLG